MKCKDFVCMYHDKASGFFDNLCNYNGFFGVCDLKYGCRSCSISSVIDCSYCVKWFNCNENGLEYVRRKDRF